jgi:ABC-2 type transport system ATP-binding protein
LSKGLRQRVALARALLNDSAALFLDEPTSGLDPVATREVHELIASLRDRGVTVFLSTQRLDEAERLCDRVAILNTTMRLIGRPDELRARLFRRSWKFGSARRSLIQTVFGDAPEVEGSGCRPALTSLRRRTLRSRRRRYVRALAGGGADIVSIGESRHSLEDVYLELITEDVEAGRR